jgi:hypothetical protein
MRQNDGPYPPCQGSRTGSAAAGMLGGMTWKRLAGLGALLLAAGVALFLAGAFVLTNNARHADISPAVYWGLGIAAVGLLLLLATGLRALIRRF